jgi:hypothetical protein
MGYPERRVAIGDCMKRPHRYLRGSRNELCLQRLLSSWRAVREKSRVAAFGTRSRAPLKAHRNRHRRVRPCDIHTSFQPRPHVEKSRVFSAVTWSPKTKPFGIRGSLKCLFSNRFLRSVNHVGLDRAMTVTTGLSLGQSLGNIAAQGLLDCPVEPGNDSR